MNETRLTILDSRAPGRTAGQAWRRNRDLVLALAHSAGASVTALANAFDLCPARVKEILRRLRSEARESGRADELFPWGDRAIRG